MSLIKKALFKVTLGIVDLRSFKEKNRDLMDARNKRIAKLKANRPANYRSSISERPPSAPAFNGVAAKSNIRNDERDLDSQLRGEMASRKRDGQKTSVPFTFG